jgi:hypothetical protein
MDKTTNIYIPRWANIFYSCLAIILLPWIFNLAQSLPTRHIVRHWDAVWVGFDIMMLAAIIATVWFVIRKRIWVILTGTALATLFIVDAWFDILTSKPGQQLKVALLFGLIEVTLAILTYRFVYMVIRNLAKQERFKVTTKKV